MTLGELVVGRTPEPRPTRGSRVARVAARRVHVDAAGVHWRTWTGRSGDVVAGDVARVVLLDLVYSGRGVDPHLQFGLLLDRAGTPLLRVGQGWGSVRQVGTERSHRAWLESAWEPLQVPVEPWGQRARRAKDARRQWPEAFSFGHAYPYWTMLFVVAGYCALAEAATLLFGIS